MLVYWCIYRVRAPKILAGDVKLGVFLSTIEIFKQLSEACGDGYKACMHLITSTHELERLTDLFNKPTDLEANRNISSFRTESTKEAREEFLKHRTSNATPSTSAEYATDLIPISVSNLVQRLANEEHAILFQCSSLRIPQGSLVAIRGGHGSGRTTLMKLFGHEIYPSEGTIFVPSHLRIVLVSQATYFVHGTITQNLTFGLSQTTSADVDNIRYILHKLGMARSRVAFERDMDTLGIEEESSEAEEDFEADFSNPFRWHSEMSYSELCKLHLARAFVMNPEVIVLERPLLNFHPEEAAPVIEMFKEHVENRGINLPADQKKHRRPRTVIFATETASQEKCADITCYIKHGHLLCA